MRLVSFLMRVVSAFSTHVAAAVLVSVSLAGCVLKSPGISVIRISPQFSDTLPLPLSEGRKPIQLMSLGSRGGASATWLRVSDGGESGAVASMLSIRLEEPPPRLVLAAVERRLRVSRGASQVYAVNQGSSSDRWLGGELQRFELERGSQHSAVVQVRFDLMDPRTREYLFVAEYCAAAIVTDTAADALAEAFSKAVSDVVAKLDADLMSWEDGTPSESGSRCR